MRGSRILIVVTAVLVVAFLIQAPSPASASSTGAGHTSVAGTRSVKDWVTFYGYVDNSPPSKDIAHPCIHPKAGGAGTYADPVTFAEPNDLHGPWCQIIYVPFLEKYFIHEDQCDPCGGVDSAHIDLWMGGDAASTHAPEKKALLACEDAWTRHSAVILSPASDEPVDTSPLFTPPGRCHGGAGD